MTTVDEVNRQFRHIVAMQNPYESPEEPKPDDPPAPQRKSVVGILVLTAVMAAVLTAVAMIPSHLATRITLLAVSLVVLVCTIVAIVRTLLWLGRL